MRNKILLNLQQQAEAANKKFYDYVRLLDQRESDPSYVHARMLYEEGWRFSIGYHRPPGLSYLLWFDGNDENPTQYTISPDRISNEILQELGLVAKDGKEIPAIAENSEHAAIMSFLLEITEEVGDEIPRDIMENKQG